MVVRRKTLVAAGNVTTCDTNFSTGVESINIFLSISSAAKEDQKRHPYFTAFFQLSRTIARNRSIFPYKKAQSTAHVSDLTSDKFWLFLAIVKNSLLSRQGSPAIRSISAPWISSTIRYKMNKRYKLFKAAVASKCPKLWQEYKKARNEVTGALRQAKASYFREAFQEIKETCTFWNMVNKATNSTTRKCIGPLK